MQKKDELFVLIMGTLGIFALIPIASVFNGLALSMLWGWFAVPIFHLPTLTVVQAIGVSLLVSYMTHGESHEKEKKDGATVTVTFAKIFMKPVIGLAFGWVIKTWM